MSLQEVVIRFRIRILACISAVVCLLVVFAFGPPLLAKPLASWNLLPRSEPLTELFFSDYRQLPARLHVGESVPVYFVVHNLEYRSITYHYTITVNYDGAKEDLLDEGNIELGHDQSRMLRKRFALLSPSPSAEIKVKLRYTNASGSQNQVIRYWVVVGADEKEL